MKAILYRRLLVILVLGSASAAVWAQRISDLPASSLGLKMPALSTNAVAGQKAFDANCASCHGRFGTGSDKGPPLLHDIYNPGHHPDAAFFSAARSGVTQHHWRFGNMPPLPQVSNGQITEIVRYVRELQQANGIYFKPHRM
ncbi:MAG: cytochrome c [Rhodocyclaceae bacterium]|nr:cytochrome c [Rhodocyclaceae bacterium]